MEITVKFNSLEEFEAFRNGGAAPVVEKTDDKPKRTRVKKDETPIVTPEPEQPPVVAAPLTPVTEPAAPSNPFPVAAVEPTAVEKLVARIVTRIDTCGQPEDKMEAWFRTQVGPEGANASMAQIKQALLPKLSETQLEGIAKLIGAQ